MLSPYNGKDIHNYQIKAMNFFISTYLTNLSELVPENAKSYKISYNIKMVLNMTLMGESYH